MSNDDRKTLNRQKGSLKAKLTALSNYIAPLQAKDSLEVADILQVEERYSKAQQILSDFDIIQNQIEVIALDEELDALNLETATFSDSYYSILSTMKNILVDFNKTNDEHSNGVVLASSSPSFHNQLSSIKLPKISLPKFDGSFEFWLEFKDTFESLIHKNESISDIQKYHYLRASLLASPAQVLRSIEFSASSYDNAWKTLCERYNNTRLLVHNHVKALFEVEPIQKESSSKIRALVDSISKNLRSLEQLQQPVHSWDTLIIYLVITKLDNVTLKEWESYKTNKEKDIPNLSDLKTFLKGRADLLEAFETKSDSKTNSKTIEKHHKGDNFIKGFHASKYKCSFCKKDHLIYSCPAFEKLSVVDRNDHIRKMRLCTNCLKSGHFEKTRRFGSCRICNLRHNTLLHPVSNQNCTNSENDDKKTTLHSIKQQTQEILLGTACLYVLDKFQKLHKVRALLDCGSQSSFITDDLAKRLKLLTRNVNTTIEGILSMNSISQSQCEVHIQSLSDNFNSNLSCIILPNITSYLPNIRFNPSLLQIPINIRLADPDFYKPQKIDLLIGADLFWEIICVGQISLGKGKPVLQKTMLGWIISGPLNVDGTRSKIKCNLNTNADLQNDLSKFWEIEECLPFKIFSAEEQACEQHFKDNTYRDSCGRFVVSLPLKESSSVLGDSKQRALQRLFSLERKFRKNSELYEQYISFLDEYRILGHMTEVADDNPVISSYYLPHHGVVKTDSLTTKLRVVFDASASTTTGISLNNIQMVGPTIQDDLLSIILRFRMHAYVISADVAKMYRQVSVNPEQRPLQRILWRTSPSDLVKTYELNTVTYGQASAAFLSIRCLFELADQCPDPDTRRVIKHDFYVDDLLTGANTIEEASKICKGVSEVLKSGCFPLRKWFSNEPKILEAIDYSDISHNVLTFDKNENTKTLGLIYNTSSDRLMFKVNIFSLGKVISKRSILSQISQIFDPLGLLSPCIIIAKLMIQKLWLLKVTWDESLPLEMHTSWLTLGRELPYLNELQVPRQVICRNAALIELHGFSDSSEVAYGGCIFLKSVDKEGNSSVRLLCSKSRVAPIKYLTLPRLELCGALVLARLFKKAVSSMNLNFSSCFFWTDSSVVLGWIQTSPHLLKTFISHRVSEIQNLTAGYEWRHVPTKDNPADFLSRGVFPMKMISLNLWWHGPQWLLKNSNQWPLAVFSHESLPEMRTSTISLLIIDKETPIFERYSSLSKLKRISALCLRFKCNCCSSREERIIGPLSQDEIEAAFLTLIRISQIQSFPLEYDRLLENKALKKKSKILGLNPFIGDKALIRVGGRLRNSNFDYDKKHPILMCAKHKLTQLIFIDEHLRLLHAGPQLLLSSIREKIWPIGGRNLEKHTVRKCIRCFRFNPKIVNPIMGDLPRNRFHSESPFFITVVDYGGPFSIKDRKGRGAKTSKCYLALFICFATKCIHLELVSELTTQGFLMTLRRFISRRGRPRHIYSDNGTNFVGADRELQALGSYMLAKKVQLETLFSKEGIEWHFIPPASPHFGGLWEAGIKSCKHHLKRVTGNAHLTFEELNTLLAQVEAILNSRPLSPLSEDPSDLCPLTASHFLIGRTLTSIPEEDMQSVPENRLSRYQRIQQIRQHFWIRWSKECVSELQQRKRWKQTQGLLMEGSLVLIKEDNLPPMQWKLGRVIQLHTGPDGVNRVGTLKTATGNVRRAFTKFCPLPIEK